MAVLNGLPGGDGFSRVHVVLCRPIYPRNVGMCARAIGNMGAGRLIIVDRTDPLGDESKQGAAHAQEILREATFYPSMQDFYAGETEGVRIAMSGKDWRLGDTPKLASTLDVELASDLSAPHLLRTSPIYLIFGTEDDGLSPEEMELCHYVCRLPTFTEINSLNLSHAVLLALYIVRMSLTTAGALAMNSVSETTKVEPDASSGVASVTSAPAANVAYPQKLIREWLLGLGFDLSSPRINIEKTLNRVLLGRAPTQAELRVLNNVLQQTVRRLGLGRDDSDRST